MFLNMHKKTRHDKNSGSMARNDRREDQGLSLMLFYTEFYAKTKSFRLTPIRTRAQGSQSGVNNPTQFSGKQVQWILEERPERGEAKNLRSYERLFRLSTQEMKADGIKKHFRQEQI